MAEEKEKKEIPIKSVKEFLDKLLEIQQQCKDEEEKNDKQIVQWFFRGEKKLYSTSCSPNVFRNDELKDNERNLILFAKRYYPSLFMECANEIQKLVIMQHFGLPTRLLDITSSPLVALYFACEDIMNDHPKYKKADTQQETGEDKKNEEMEVLCEDSKDKSGRVFIGYLPEDGLDYNAEMYANALAVIVSNLSKDKMTDDSIINTVLEDFNVFKGSQIRSFEKLESKLKERQYEYIVYDSIKNNKRIANQCGQFIFGSDIKNPKYDGFRDAFKYEMVIPYDQKHNILKELDMRGVNSATIYSDAEHQMKYLKYKAERRDGFFIKTERKK